MIYSRVGSLQHIDGKNYIVTKKGQSGYALYGPYVTLDPGAYCVTFRLKLSEPSSVEPDTICGRLEVTTAGGKVILAQTNLYRSRLLERNHIQLVFHLSASSQVEYRVETNGMASFAVDCERVVKRVSEDKKYFAPMIDVETSVESELVEKNNDRFRHIFERGGEVLLNSSLPILKFGSVHVLIKRTEQFQVAQEVFLANEYGFLINRDVMFIDIGMNAGFTSLYAAQINKVKQVHGFEPFSTPFSDALENFKLNPELSRKITPYHFGLGDCDQELTVSTDSESTIGVSIMGKPSGVVETIKIRDIANVLKDLIKQASHENLDVVLKLDCEGSEFPIFDKLSRLGMLRDISIYMVEWHKWWSAERSQQDLILPLQNANFVIFDRTRASDQYAGVFLAVRRD